MAHQTTGRKVAAGRAAPARPREQRRIIRNKGKVKNTMALANDDANLDQRQIGAENAMAGDPRRVVHEVQDLSPTAAKEAAARLGSRPSPYIARAPPVTTRPAGVRLLSYLDLRARGVRYSRVHLRRLEGLGQFPQHLTLGEGLGALIAWPEHEVVQWIAERMARRLPAGQAASISTP
jgi:predicted DNA-binding transcriptional regulator AlpA